MSEFKNENVNVKLEKLPNSNVKLEVAVSVLATKAAYEKAIKNINKEIVIPGFRKGKAPAQVVVEKFKSHIDEEWRSVLLNTALQESLALVKTYPFLQNSVKPEIKNISLEKGAEITYAFEARPNIPEIEPSEIVLKNVDPAPVTEKEIEERIHELQLNQATWEDIEERGIQEGDFIKLDIDSLDNDVSICKDQLFRVTKESLGQWLFSVLLDKKTNEVFEATSEKEPCKQCDDHTHVHPEEDEFKPSKLKIHVKVIRVPILPSLDLEFAKKLGAESIESLNTRIVASLEKNSKDHAQAELRHQLEKALMEKYPFDVPLSMLRDEGRHLDEQTLANAINSLRMYFITQKLAAQLDLEVNQDEIMEEFMVQTYMTAPENSYIDPKDDPKEINQQIRSHLIDKKIKDYLIERARKD